MSSTFKKYLQQVVISIVFWAIAMAAYCMFRFYGLSNLDGVSINEEYQEAMEFKNIVRLFIFSGILVGFVFANIEYFFEKYGSKRITIGLEMLLKAAFYIIAMVVVSTIAKTLASFKFGIEIHKEAYWWQDQSFQAILVYIFFVSLAFSFIKIANEKFGKGVFLKMLLGRYKKPQEEKRIFMFLDLKSSTTIAENLGHFKYSQLIQDCFYDLNEIVPKYSAEIYQYVGDEAVISWPYKKGLANNNCVRMYFEFAQALNNKADYYNQKYGLTPMFKAGLHGGTLMVAEVGVVKKELAFHGDVINTSARIQSECNTYNVPILISESLKNQLIDSSIFNAKHMGTVLLKGKEEKVGLFTLSETTKAV